MTSASRSSIRFPVSPGHVLVITRRAVPTFFECTAAEQQALMALVGEVKALLDERHDPKPDGYHVGFNAGVAAGQTVPHVHVHVIPRYAGDMGDPRGGVRHVIPEKGNYLAGSQAAAAEAPRLSLTTGPDRPLWPRLPGASEIDLLASFVQPSGLDVIRAGLFSAIAAAAPAAPVAFTPRPWQQEALASLAAIRRDGSSKALVAVAIGLGKTWLAAFDVIAVGRELGRPPRVLVIARRAEILAQAHEEPSRSSCVNATGATPRVGLRSGSYGAAAP